MKRHILTALTTVCWLLTYHSHLTAADILRPPNTVLVYNEAATGTVANKLVKLTGAPSTGIVTTAGNTGGAVGICISGCGTAAVSATASVVQWGNVSCVFDGATMAGNYIGISATVAGDCMDAGAVYPITGQVLGRVLSTNGGGGTYPVVLFGPDMQRGGGAPASYVPGWYKYSLIAIANGVNGCANAAGCWQVNGVLGANKTAGLTQDVVLAALPAKWHVTDWSIKTAVVCTGATTALSGLGVTSNTTLFRAQTYDIAAAVADANLTTGPTAGAGANTTAGTNLVASLITTVNNVDQLVVGCAVDYHVLESVRP